MISAEQLGKSFGAVCAVQDLSLRVDRGDVLGILGPNGAGKTTTVRMICGLLPPSTGSVSVDGHDVVTEGPRARRAIGYLPEHSPLPVEMPVESFLRFRGALFDLAGARAREAADRAMRRCWLEDVRRRPIRTLSKGYRQRVGLAAALLHDPPVLILDEPTSGLDPSQIAETRSLIRELAGTRTMVLVSHILPEVERTCDRIAVIAGGRCRAVGTPEEILRVSGLRSRTIIEVDPGHAGQVRAMFEDLHVSASESLGADEPKLARFSIEADDAVALRQAAAKLAVERSVPLVTLTSERPTLERAYLTLVGATGSVAARDAGSEAA